MIQIGQEIFDLCELIVTTPREALQDNPLFLQFGQYMERGDPLGMAFIDVFPNGAHLHVSWCLMSFENWYHLRIDQLRERVVFDNVNDLIRGLLELYRHVHIQGNGLNMSIKCTLELVATCLKKIEGCLHQDEALEALSSMSL